MYRFICKTEFLATFFQLEQGFSNPSCNVKQFSHEQKGISIFLISHLKMSRVFACLTFDGNKFQYLGPCILYDLYT